MTYVPIKTRREIPASWQLSESEKGFGSLMSSQGMLPLRSLDVTGSIRALNYSLSVCQIFHNVHQSNLEATYIFPLPARAAVTKFVMTTEQRRVEGQLKERGQARQEYQEAISAGHQAALAEQERPDIFTMTVGNVPPNQQVQVEIELEGPLYGIDDSALLRFPLVVAPKYIPGAPLNDENVGQGTALDTDRVPDASRISPPVLLPGFPNPVKLSLQFDVEGSLFQLQDLEATLPLEGVATNEGFRLRYQPQSGRIDHDFMLRLPFHPNKVTSSLQVESQTDQACTFCLTVVPPASAVQQTQPKQVVIVLDRSGSMEGWKMEAAKRATARLIDSLNQQDSFQVLVFDDQVELVGNPPPTRKNSWFKHGPSNSLAQATDRQRFDTIMALREIHSRGGTEIASALREAAQRLKDCPNGHIIFVTDGQVGNENEVLRETQKQAANLRVHSIGIDQAVNAHFLEELARCGKGGLCQLVASNEQLDNCMVDMCRRIGAPVLTNIRVDAAGISDVVYQNNDLYAGIVTRIYGRFQGQFPQALQLLSDQSEKNPELAQTIQTQYVGGTVRRLWAREKILQLEHNYAISSPKAISSAEITAFSLQHGVLSRFTAFLAVDRDVLVQKRPLHQVTQAVENPAGWGSVCSVGGSAGPGAASAPKVAQMLKSTWLADDTADSTLDMKCRSSAPANAPSNPPAPARPIPPASKPRPCAEQAQPSPPSSPQPCSPPTDALSKKTPMAKKMKASHDGLRLSQSKEESREREKSAQSEPSSPSLASIWKTLKTSVDTAKDFREELRANLQKLIDLLIDRAQEQETDLLAKAMETRSKLGEDDHANLQLLREFVEWADQNSVLAQTGVLTRVKNFFLGR